MVQGLQQLERKLTVTMPKRVEDAARKAMEKGAEELVAMMKRLVPVDTGELRDSIKWRWGAAPKGSVLLAESNSESRGLKITVYATDFKARWIEFGTVKMKAHPYFFTSYRTLKKRIKSRVTREMKKALKAEMGQ